MWCFYDSVIIPSSLFRSPHVFTQDFQLTNAHTHCTHAEIYCLHHRHVLFCQAKLKLMSMLIQNTKVKKKGKSCLTVYIRMCIYVCIVFLLRRAINLYFAVKYMSKTHGEWYFTRGRSRTFILCECPHMFLLKYPAKLIKFDWIWKICIFQ